jgi:hypothetical protein
MTASKIDQLPLTDEQGSELQSDLADVSVSNMAIVRKIESWGFEIGETSVRRYRSNLGIRSNGTTDPTAASEASAVTAILKRAGLKSADADRVGRTKLYQGFMRGPDGEPQTKDMISVTLHPSFAEGPKWPVVQPVPPMTVQYAPLGERKQLVDAEDHNGWHTAVVLPDIQFGFYRDSRDRLHPTHDEDALAVALAVTADAHPTKVVLVGDILDFPELGKYRLSPPFERTTQASLNRAGQFTVELRSAVGPECEIDWLAGNHEERLAHYVLDNAAAAFGIRQANIPESWPVLSVPHLLNLDTYNVKYVPGYPAGEVWINDRLRVIHGDKVVSGGSTAHRYLNEERVSTIFGHIHRREWAERTRHGRDGGRTVLSMSPGCLCRIDGAIPSTKGGVDLDGIPMTRYEDWQQGLAVITYEDGDGRFAPEQIPIHDGFAFWRGREYSANPERSTKKRHHLTGNLSPLSA